MQPAWPPVSIENYFEMKAVVMRVNYACQGPQKMFISIYFSLMAENQKFFLLDKFLISLVALQI